MCQKSGFSVFPAQGMNKYFVDTSVILARPSHYDLNVVSIHFWGKTPKTWLGQLKTINVNKAVNVALQGHVSGLLRLQCDIHIFDIFPFTGLHQKRMYIVHQFRYFLLLNTFCCLLVYKCICI